MLVAAPLLLAESRAERAPRSYDVTGALAVTGGLVLLIGAVVQLPHAADSPLTVTLLAVAGAGLLAWFARHERRTGEPLVDLAALSGRSSVWGNLTLLLLMSVAWGTGLTLSGFGQRVLGFTPVEFGVATSAMTVMTLVGSWAAQRAVPRYGVGAVGAAAGLLMVAASALLALGATRDATYVRDLLPGLLVLGLGIGGGPVAAIGAALSAVPPEHSGAASGLNTAAFQVGGAVGTAVVGTVLVAGGYRSAFVACGLLAASACLCASRLWRRP
jgi:predicted MFS family arabinose efflux permease